MDRSYFQQGAVFGIFVGLITFVSSWIYCIAAYGFLLGVGLGWLPSLIVAAFAYFLTVLLWGPIALILVLAIIKFMGG
jgi:hypothetical protein